MKANYLDIIKILFNALLPEYFPTEKQLSRQASQEIWVAKIVEEKAEKLNPE